MLINADFRKPVLVTPNQYRWIPSPQPGVERVMLDRLGAESGHATSIVRYAPRSSFPRHKHHGGEEILVLAGTFSDEHNDYPAGWYLRNPPGSSHQPSSEPGAIIFVKLCQMRSDEESAVRVDTRDPANWLLINGQRVCPLFQDKHERVRLVELGRSELLFRGAVSSAELLVLHGELRVNGELFEAGGWTRLPRARNASIRAASTSATVYLKTGHLAELASTPSLAC